MVNPWVSQVGLVVKKPACQCRRCKKHGFNPWVGKIPRRRAWKSTPIFLPGESHGQKSLTGYSPQGCKELDPTEAPSLSLSNFSLQIFIPFLVFFLTPSVTLSSMLTGNDDIRHHFPNSNFKCFKYFTSRKICAILKNYMQMLNFIKWFCLHLWKLSYS